MTLVLPVSARGRLAKESVVSLSRRSGPLESGRIRPEPGDLAARLDNVREANPCAEHTGPYRDRLCKFGTDPSGRQSLLWIAHAAVHDSVRYSLHPDDWERLLHDAEANHLAPLLEYLLRSHGQQPPEATLRQLRALGLRHLAWHRARTAALTEVLDTFERLSIETLVLKGAALAWMIYQSPSLRPMSDVDLMVPRAAAPAAQDALRRLGFDAASAFRRFGRNAHHYPVAARTDDGLAVRIEIHVDALSPDTLSSLALSELTEPPQRFLLDGTPRLTLGHVDMLRHLTQHLLEPMPDGYARLIGVVDVLRYARTFHDRIDWQRLDTAGAIAINTLRCLHYYISLPEELNWLTPSRNSTPPDGVGEIMRPLRSIVRRGRPVADILDELLNPSKWWMHAYYGVPPGQSLRTVRLIRHPWRVTRWFASRIAAF